MMPECGSSAIMDSGDVTEDESVEDASEVEGNLESSEVDDGTPNFSTIVFSVFSIIVLLVVFGLRGK